MGSSKLPVDASPGCVGLHVHPSNPKASVVSGQGEKKELLQHSEPSSCNLCRQQCPTLSTRVNPKALAQLGHQQHLLSHCRDRSVLEKPGHHCALNPSPGHPSWSTQSWSARGTKASDVERGEMPPVAPSTNQSDPGELCSPARSPAASFAQSQPRLQQQTPGKSLAFCVF